MREKLARIDQMLAQHDRDYAQIGQLNADRNRKRQEMKYQPFFAVISGMTAGAALFAAGIAFVKLLG